MRSSEALKGHLDGLLLSVLQSGPAHGYAIVEALRARSAGAFTLPEGTVYPALHRLENAELLASKWVQVGGRRRRVYSLTARGRRSLAKQRSAWEQFSNAVTTVLEEAPWPSKM